MKNCFVEVAYYQICKSGQKSPGDCFLSRKNPSDGRILSVLSDGLGSGIKANVLATLTATMAIKCVAGNISVPQTAEIITRSLPVCSRRHISYSTFTIVDIAKKNQVKVIEYDNPRFLFLRGDRIVEDLKSQEIEFQHLANENAPGIKTRVNYYECEAQPGDRIIFYSDGLTQSGMGSREFPLGWGNKKIWQFAQELVERVPNLSARDLARTLVRRAHLNDQESAKDDITCGVIYFRQPRRLLLVSGPPYLKESDTVMADFVRNFDGKKIISGGTTANILSRELKEKIEVQWYTADPKIPPASTMKGVELVTEGVITLSRVYDLLDKGTSFDNLPRNAAGLMLEQFINADYIEFLVGTKINEIHQDPSLPVELELRRNLIRRIADCLRTKYLKEVEIHYL